MRRLRPLWAGFLVVALAGCAGYRVGPTNGLDADEKTIQIIPFTNQTMEPRLSDAVTAALRKEFQRDSTYRLATSEAGDFVVTGVITQYHRREVSLQPNDVLTGRDYQVSMTAHVTARERGTGKVLLDRPVTGYTLIRVGSDLTSAERQALPLLADDLAKQVTALVADGSW